MNIDPNTSTYLMAKIKLAENTTQHLHDRISHWRDLYNYKHRGDIPMESGEKQFQDPTYTNVVDLAVGIMLNNPITFTAYGWSPDMIEERVSSQIEKFLGGLLNLADEDREENLQYEVTKNVIRDGMGVLYTVWRPEVLPVPGQDDEGQQVMVFPESPLHIEVIDPMNIFMVPGGRGRWQAIMRKERMKVHEVEALYGVTIPVKPEMSKPESLLEEFVREGDFIDYWEVRYNEKSGAPEVYNAKVFDGHVIDALQVMEGYEDIPYTIGFFKPNVKGDSYTWTDNIMVPLESTIDLQQRAIQRRMRQIDVYSELPIIARSGVGRKIVVESGYSKIVNLQGDESIGFPQWQGNPPDVEEHINFLQGRVDSSGFSSAMFGAGASQVSGYALSQLSDQNRIRLEQPKKHLELLWKSWAKKVLRLVDIKAKDAHIRVYGRMRGRYYNELIKGGVVGQYKVDCEIKPEFPNERVRNHAMATQVRGVVSMHTIMQDYLGIEQPDDERQRMMIESMQTHPVLISYTLMKKLRANAANGDEDAELALMLVQQQLASLQQNMATGAMNNPEQASGMPAGGMGMAPPGQDVTNEASNMAKESPGMLG